MGTIGDVADVSRIFANTNTAAAGGAIAALIFGGNWSIANKDAINTSFPSFLKKIKYLGAKIH